jgi:uncharacterized protein YbjT (DUF2867 family)
MDMALRLVTVFGGSGFVGSAIVERLAHDGVDVRVAVRRPERVRAAAAAGRGRIMPVRADVWEEGSVAPAVAGADAVVNTVGHYVARGQRTFEAIHGQGARNVAKTAASAGVRRLVHISGIGADLASPSPYVRARAMGERFVREAFPEATIFRPSVIFGPGDAFFNLLARLTRVLPVLPLFGTGATRLQPVFVGDVAEALARALVRPEAAGRTYELGGPHTYTYREILQLVLRQTGRRRLLLPVPFRVWDMLAALLSPLLEPPVSGDQVTLMKEDNVVGSDVGTLSDLGITPTPVEAILPAYLERP